MTKRYLERQEYVANKEDMTNNELMLEYYLLECEYTGDPDFIPQKTYGIEIVKLTGSTVEKYAVENFAFCRECTRNVLNMLAKNTVTPVSMPFILDDICGV